MTKDETLKLTLEALKWSKPHADAEITYNDAIIAIKEALAQPEQEPVAKIVSTAPERIWLDLGFDPTDEDDISFHDLVDTTWSEDNATGYGIEYVRADTTPPQRKPLTDEEICDAVRESDLDWHYGWTLDDEEPNRFTKFARAIEAAHGIKGEA